MDLKIYNLFPRLYTGIDAWLPVVQEARRMGFNAIYLNPFFETGKSGSIYSIANHKQFDPISVGDLPWDQCVEKIQRFSTFCWSMDMEVIFDLVINHTAIDSSLCLQHPNWYASTLDGDVQPACTYTLNGTRVVWEDCAKLSYDDCPQDLRDYIVSVCQFYIDLGATGFRCDVACHVPVQFWKYLIDRLRMTTPGILFLGEAFLASYAQIVKLAEAGFNYVFNSARWWDLSQDWLPKQLNSLYNIIATISFPENHDTERVLEEIQGNQDQCRQRLTLMAMLSSGFMITSGFEYGFRKRLNVQTTRSTDWEETGVDLREDVRRALLLRTEFPIFREDGILEVLSPENAEVLVLEKTSRDRQALIVVNRTAQPINYSCQPIGKLLSLKKYGVNDPLSLTPFEVKFFVPKLRNGDNLELGENQSFCLESPRQLVRKTTLLMPLRPGEALVEIMGCGICGSDYQEFQQGRFFWPASGTGGHEFLGAIRQLSPPTHGLKLSQRVLYRIPRHGTGIVQGGGFSRFAVVRSQCLHALADTDNPEHMILTEPLAAAIHAGYMAGRAKKIAVIGSGTIALLLLRFLALEKPNATLTLYYKHDHILPLLAETVSAHPYSELAAPLGTYMPYSDYELIYECSGKEDAALQALRALRPGGRLVIAGIYRNKSIPFPFSDLMFREKQVLGSFLYTKKEFQQAMALLRAGQIFGNDLITSMRFEDCQEAFSLPSNQRIKVVLWNDV